MQTYSESLSLWYCSRKKMTHKVRRYRYQIGQKNGPKAEKDKTERATKLGRRTREEIQKSGTKLTAPEIPDREETSESPVSLRPDQIQL